MAYGLSNATASNMTENIPDITVTPLNVDNASDLDETVWFNADWPKYWGYFNDPDLGELHSAFIMKGIWDVGKGYTADPETTVILDHISGWGKDTFLNILFNADVISRLGGDSYAEIVLDEDSGTLLNLKPLDPGRMRHVVDRKGLLKKYRYMSNDGKKVMKDFEPDEIFHLCHNRFADQIHGVSDIITMENTILAEKESFKDTKRLVHTQVRPFIIFKLRTDDLVKIDAFVAKCDAAREKGENMYIPDDENLVSWEIVQINPSDFVLAWRNDIKNKFYRALGLPLIVFGNAGTTESGGKIEYLAHEQVFAYDQLFLEDQVWNQLYLRIKLNSPVTLLENLQRDERKDANQGLEFQQSDVTPGSGA